MSEVFESKLKDLTDVTKWLKEKGFGLEIVEAFEGK